jgi:hypothetical protein
MPLVQYPQKSKNISQIISKWSDIKEQQSPSILFS